MEKQARYSELLSQIEVFANADDNAISVLANCAAVMKMLFPKEYFWVGFYIVEGDELILGPFQGTPACTRIKFGRGVCGTAWKEQRTLVVEDVEKSYSLLVALPIGDCRSVEAQWSGGWRNRHRQHPALHLRQ